MVKRALQMCLALCFLFATTFLCSCDDGLKMVGIEIVSYPDRLVYVKDVSTELDLNGGVYRIERKDGYCYDCNMSEYIPGHSVGISSHVDFSREGIYCIALGSNRFECDFPVQVVSPEDYGITQEDIGSGRFLDE